MQVDVGQEGLLVEQAGREPFWKRGDCGTLRPLSGYAWKVWWKMRTWSLQACVAISPLLQRFPLLWSRWSTTTCGLRWSLTKSACSDDVVATTKHHGIFNLASQEKAVALRAASQKMHVIELVSELVSAIPRGLFATPRPSSGSYSLMLLPYCAFKFHSQLQPQFQFSQLFLARILRCVEPWRSLHWTHGSWTIYLGSNLHLTFNPSVSLVSFSSWCSLALRFCPGHCAPISRVSTSESRGPGLCFQSFALWRTEWLAWNCSTDVSTIHCYSSNCISTTCPAPTPAPCRGAEKPSAWRKLVPFQVRS